MKPVSPKSQFNRHLRRVATSLVSGTALCIDPSVGSSSSMPGYAVYSGGTLVASGVLNVRKAGELWQKLAEVHGGILDLCETYGPVDVLVYEDVPAMRHGGVFAAGGHATLHKAIGATLSAPGPRDYLPVAPVMWKCRVRPDYVKSDEADAIEMGWVALELAKLHLGTQNKPTRNRGK